MGGDNVVQRENSLTGRDSKSDSKEKRHRSRSPHKREDWMVKEPKKSTLKVDPLSMSSRQFTRSYNPSPRSKDRKSIDDSSDILEEKDAENCEKEKEIEANINKYNQLYRNESLTEAHRKYRLSKDVDESKSFDWDRDIRSGAARPTLDYTKGLISKAGSLQSRFGSSQGKKYL